jgi:CHAD domain-containing protein
VESNGADETAEDGAVVVGAGHPVEREAKFSVGPDFEIPDLGGVSEQVETLPERSLRASYLDTPDLRLWSRQITVRHRTGEGPEVGVWTAKLPTSGNGPTLDRYELSWSGPGDRVPEDLAALLLGVVRHSSLGVVAELTTRRHRLALRDASGASLAEIDDDHVTVQVDARAQGSFRQIEVEIAPGGDSLLGPVSDRLARAGAAPSNQPKLARALAMVVVVEAEGDPGLDRRARMADVVRNRIADGLGRMLEHDVRLRLDPEDPPARSIHQARVATRRLRSDLLLLSAFVDASWVQQVRGDLQWMGQMLGAIRDADVLALGLESTDPDAPGGLPVDGAGLEELRSRLAAQRRTHARSLAQALADSRYLDLLDRLFDAGGNLPLAPGESDSTRHRSPADRRATKVLPGLVASRLEAFDRAEAKGGRHPSDVQLHHLRIKAKQLRYAAETAAPVVGKRARRLGAAAAAAQGLLGDLHDTVTAQAWLRTQAEEISGPAAFTAGQVRRRQQLRRQWKASRHRLDSKKVRGWLPSP